jgi:predicted alpha/beta hydrolase
VLTYDYRGVGRSRRGPLGRAANAMTMRDWAERDAVAAHRALVARDPSARVLAVAHSFGGQTLGLSDALHDVSAAAMVGVQFGYVGHWPAAGRARLGLAWNVLVPSFSSALGYVPGWSGIGEDLPGGVAREWDIALDLAYGRD